MTQNRVGLERRKYRERLGQPGGLDNQPPERWHHPAFAPGVEIAYGERQFTADSAAETPRSQQHHSLVDPLDEMMIEPDFAEFVDQHRGSGQRRIGQQTAQQSRLAGTEKAGKQ